MKAKKETRGGPGRGQGRKNPFKEPTKGIKFMCPISKEIEFKAYVKIKLDSWVKK
jgi:hypothetical protein